MMQVVIPMSGAGERFRRAGYTMPKPLIPIEGRPLIAHLLAKFPKEWRFVFICNKDHLKSTPLRRILKGLAPRSVIVPIDPHKKGPVHAVLKGSKHIQDDLPTIVNYCDFSFVWDSDHFRSFTQQTKCDGAILAYRGFHPHYLRPTLYAYCREERGRVLEIKEKAYFTDNRLNEFASSGSYYFRSGRMTKRFCREAVRQQLSLNGEYYASLVYNPMIQAGLDVRIYEIPYFLQWGTPEDLEDYGYWSRAFKTWERQKTSRPKPSAAPRLLMPMAGLGKRFSQEGFPPKAFCPTLGRPMFRTAMEFLPASTSAPVLVALQEHAEEIRRQGPEDMTLLSLDKPTEGQAMTCLKAEPALDGSAPVLVSSCDHGLLWNDRRWRALLDDQPDVVVVGQRNYPGARRTPTHFAYIQTEEKSDKIRHVSVKKPLSERPDQDLLLVGTFYFRRAGDMFNSIRTLAHQNLRVNGELYLDSVVNLCIQAGMDVRVFESTAYLCWGTPDSWREFNYWHAYFNGFSRRSV